MERVAQPKQPSNLLAMLLSLLTGAGHLYLDHYLTGVIYPAEHLLTAQLAVAAAVLVSWVGLAFLHWRARARSRAFGPEARYP